MQSPFKVKSLCASVRKYIKCLQILQLPHLFPTPTIRRKAKGPPGGNFINLFHLTKVVLNSYISGTVLGPGEKKKK